MARLNPSWAAEMRLKIERGLFKSEIYTNNKVAQFVIACAAENNTPMKVTNLGAGVKRITVAENICPHCGGKGYVE